MDGDRPGRGGGEVKMNYHWDVDLIIPDVWIATMSVSLRCCRCQWCHQRNSKGKRAINCRPLCFPSSISWLKYRVFGIRRHN